jgi:hypothetical protein
MARLVLGQHLGLHRFGFVRAAVDIGERLAAGVTRRVSFRCATARGSGGLSWLETGWRFSRLGAGEYTFQRGDRTHQIVTLMYLPLR